MALVNSQKILTSFAFAHYLQFIPQRAEIESRMVMHGLAKSNKFKPIEPQIPMKSSMTKKSHTDAIILNARFHLTAKKQIIYR